MANRPASAPKVVAGETKPAAPVGDADAVELASEAKPVVVGVPVDPEDALGELEPEAVLEAEDAVLLAEETFVLVDGLADAAPHQLVF